MEGWNPTPGDAEEHVAAIVARVVRRLEAEGKLPGPTRKEPANGRARRPNPGAPASRGGGGQGGVYTTMEEAVEAAHRAFARMGEMGLDQRFALIDEIRRRGRGAVQALARLAVEETGLGRVEDKVLKNLLVLNETPGPEILKPMATSGDRGLTLVERGPWGVIGTVTPSTNPSETVFCNAIGMLAGGNSVVFNPHPGARRVSLEAVALINQASRAVGGPEEVVTAVTEPTVESAQALMAHPQIDLLVVTGGAGVVQEALRHGKKVIAGGPGNPPVVVDETANLGVAAAGIVLGAGLDNNVVCSDEKEIFAVEGIADELMARMQERGAFVVQRHLAERLMDVVFEEWSPRERRGRIDKRYVGKDASVILKAAGIRAPAETRIALVVVEPDHPLVWTEQLMPVIPLVRAADASSAVDLAIEAEGGRGHTAVIYSNDLSRLSDMARRIKTCIFVKNGPSLAGLGYGGEGYTSFTIAGPTGEGMTTAVHFTRERRCTLVDAFRIV